MDNLYDDIQNTLKSWGENLGLVPKPIVSPLPDQATLDTPVKAFQAKDTLQRMERAHLDPNPKVYGPNEGQIKYPDWMANAPTPTLSQGTPNRDMVVRKLAGNNITPTPTVPMRTSTLGVATQEQSGQYPQQYSAFSDFTTTQVPQNLQPIIYNAAQQYGVNPAILASLLFSEHGLIADNNKTFNRDPNTGAIIPGNYDRGIAQINAKAHPEITDEQAFDPNFAIPWAAKTLSGHIKNLGGDINRGIAAYNVGEGGAQIQGPTPSGLGPRGQAYLNKVAAGLTPDLRKKLGIILAQ